MKYSANVFENRTLEEQPVTKSLIRKNKTLSFEWADSSLEIDQDRLKSSDSNRESGKVENQFNKHHCA